MRDMQWIYLDNNATTPPAPQVARAVHEMHEQLWANPSSVHRFGQMARGRLELARSEVARLINCRDRQLVFTSGGTESNHLALRGVLGPKPSTDGRAGGVLITTAVEHSAIKEPADELGKLGVEVVRLPVDQDGRVEGEQLLEALDRHAATEFPTLVSVQWANNETGVIQPMAMLLEAVHKFRQSCPQRRVLFHSDAVQAVGKLAVDVQALRVDLLSISAHKFHGPKGTGALYIRRGVGLWPQLRGGPQERQRRGGTENTAGIVGMGMAAALACDFLADGRCLDALVALRDRFESAIVDVLPDTVIHSNSAAMRSKGRVGRLWNTTNLGFPRLEAEAILVGLSERGLCTSAGAACSSGSLEPSPVLLAMGIREPVAHGSVRFSLSRFTTAEQIEAAIPIVLEVVGQLRRTLPVPA